jgi:hypothetical protein
MKGLLADAMCLTSISDSLPCLHALENVDDLLFGESRLAYNEFSSSASLRENSQYCCTSFRGGGQVRASKSAHLR